jgi:Flp pilus assembly protein TadD
MSRAFGVSLMAMAALQAAWSPLAFAQSVDALDALVAASAKPKDGLVLAQQQIGLGDLLVALATLERVLTQEPKNKQAKLLHASVLCRVDDPDGAALEFSKLKAGDFKKPEWAAAIAPCAGLGGAAK